MRISDCPAAVNSIMARSKEAIARLDEKALRGGGKSEDQPLLEKMPKPSMEGLSAKADFNGVKSGKGRTLFLTAY